MTLAHTYRFRADGFGEHFGFGWEMGRIGAALATGYGYADPFRGHTGPTAWVAPFYPLLVAGVFKLFGVYSALSAWVLLALNCCFSALTVRPVWEIARRCFNRRTALWAAWIWALYPAAMQYAVRWVWETALTALLLSWVLVLALRLRGIGEDPGGASDAGVTRRRWACFGLLWGLIALSNPSLLLFLPLSGLWVLAGARDRRQQLSGALLAALLWAACVAPWSYRNWVVFHHFIPMRGNFGAELYLGNGPGSTGLLMEYDHPNQAPDQLRLYAQMGEIAYSQMRGRLAQSYIRGNPAHFAALCLRRLYFFWAGTPQPSGHPWQSLIRSLNFGFASLAGLFGLTLALRQRNPAATLFALAFLSLPLVYYFVSVHARFRHPLEPLIAILGVHLFQSAQPARHRPAENGLQTD